MLAYIFLGEKNSWILHFLLLRKKHRYHGRFLQATYTIFSSVFPIHLPGYALSELKSKRKWPSWFRLQLSHLALTTGPIPWCLKSVVGMYVTWSLWQLCWKNNNLRILWIKKPGHSLSNYYFGKILLPNLYSGWCLAMWPFKLRLTSWTVLSRKAKPWSQMHPAAHL